MNTKGIDVSKHQGAINWPAVAADGVEFAMIRAGYGMYSSQKDPYFDQNVIGAQDAGIRTGAYWYSYAQTPDEAVVEAKLCLEAIGPYALDYPVAFDLEDASQEGLSSETLTQIVEAFCGTVEAAGYYTMLYANKHWLQNKLIYDRIKQWDIWLAHYVTATDYDKPHGIWQCSSKAKIAGVNGNCDLDWSYKDYPALIIGAGLNGCSRPAPETPEEPDTAYHVGDVVTVSSYYASSTEADADAATVPSTWQVATITRVLPGAHNPYLLNDGALGWCNDGDIRGAGDVRPQATPPKYSAGTYTLTANVRVRTGAGTGYRQKSKSELTADGQRHANAVGILQSGTVITVQEIAQESGNWWGRIPSGWIALEYQGNRYVK